jgi:cytochrome c-type biogenesis protein CcmE
VTTSRPRAWVAVALIAAALGFLLFRGLGNATVYFKTVDEAVAERDRLGDRRFRIEGTVVTEPRDGRFTIQGERHRTEVVHTGDVPQLMQVGIPAVLEGRWDGDRFASDEIMVKHTPEYREKNPERVNDYPPRP